MNKISVKQITWKCGEPATWPGLYAKDEVPFSCMLCRKQTATHRVTLGKDGTEILRVVVCGDCAGKDNSEYIAWFDREKTK